MGITTLTECLDLEQIDTRIFRSQHLYDDKYPLYGGQVIAQVLAAAGKTVDDDRTPHSFHCYFLRSGDASQPVVLHVECDFDGGSFSSRRVIAVQNGQVICNASLSFHRGADGPEHVMVAPEELVDPDSLHPWPSGRLAVELRSFVAHSPGDRLPRRLYVRIPDVPDDPHSQLAALGYLTDISTGLADVRHRDLGYLATIDHSAWLHAVPDVTQWHLIQLEPRRTGSGRGLYTGSIFALDGTLVTTIAQESLFRWAKKA